MRKILVLIAFSVMLCTALCANCPGAQIYDSINKTCLMSKYECTDGFISSDQFNCNASCAQGESAFEYKQKNILKFKQCYKCDTGKFFNISWKTLMFTCESECYNNYDQKDSVNFICNPCQKLPLFDAGYTCKDSCTNSQQVVLYYEDDNQYVCTNQCRDNQVINESNRHCISPTQCKTYVIPTSKYCVQNCPTDYFIYERNNTLPFQICEEYCNYLTFYPENNSNTQCIEKCPEGYFENDDYRCISKEDCKDKIYSYDGKSCLDGCPESFYPKTRDDGLLQCSVCNKYLQIGDSSNGNLCVDDCPEGYIESDYNEKYCIKRELCTLFNIDKTKCAKNCKYPDLKSGNKCINPCKGKSSDCIPECNEGQFMRISQSGYECQDFCYFYLSSDLKYCVPDCQQVNEIKPNNSDNKICEVCKSNEIVYFDAYNSKFICITKNSVSLQGRMDNFVQSSYLGYQSFFMHQKGNEQLNDFFSEISSLNNTQTLISQFSYLIQLAEFQHLIVNKESKTSNVQDSKKSFLLKMESPVNGQKLKSVLDFTQFNSDPNYSLQEVSENALGDSKVVYTVLSQKNPFCHSDGCKFSNLIMQTINKPVVRNLQTVQNGQESQIFKVLFPIDKSIQKLEQLICVTYDSYGRMSANLQWTNISADKTTVTCSYTTNTALYIDSTCIFIAESNCKKETPILDEKVEEEEDDDDLRGGEIAGIVTGSVACALIFAFVVYKLIVSQKLSQAKVSSPRTQTLEQNKFV